VRNAAGEVVASRVLSTTGNECASLAKGLAVWASLVLDSEADRPKPPERSVPLDDPLAGPPAARSDVTAWPTTPPPEARSPEADLFLEHGKNERTVELGLATFIMGGTGGGAVVGPAAYGVFEAAHGFFLRPAILVGHTVGEFVVQDEIPATFVASRFDACARLPGFYREHKGLQIDLCAGADVGFSLADSGVIANNGSGTLPFVGVGPSVGIRGELASNLSATIRAVGDVNLLRDTVALANGQEATPPAFAGRGEVGLSWSLR
jgi:hypothetical protein